MFAFEFVFSVNQMKEEEEKKRIRSSNNGSSTEYFSPNSNDVFSSV